MIGSSTCEHAYRQRAARVECGGTHTENGPGRANERTTVRRHPDAAACASSNRRSPLPLSDGSPYPRAWHCVQHCASTVQALCKHCASTVHSTGIRKKAGTIRANLGGTAGAAGRIPSQSRFSVLVFLFSGHCTKEVPQWITDLQKTSKT